MSRKFNGCNARRANTCAQNITKSFIRLANDNRIPPISLDLVFLVCFSMIVGVFFLISIFFRIIEKKWTNGLWRWWHLCVQNILNLFGKWICCFFSLKLKCARKASQGHMHIHEVVIWIYNSCFREWIF